MTLKYEKAKIKAGYKYIIGCDEVGRGCLAGPVVAAAVIFDVKSRPKWFSEINDSKKLSAEKREYLSALIKASSLWSVGEVSADAVDKINIHNAALLAMKKAVEGLSLVPQNAFLYIDGKFPIPNLDINQQALIEGDNKVLSIAAASIIAKVYRDELMQKFHKTFPVYNFSRHKGYATQYHRSMILQNGISPIHRLTFCTNYI